MNSRGAQFELGFEQLGNWVHLAILELENGLGLMWVNGQETQFDFYFSDFGQGLFRLFPCFLPFSSVFFFSTRIISFSLYVFFSAQNFLLVSFFFSRVPPSQRELGSLVVEVDGAGEVRVWLGGL